jgi:hypothetical protein
MDERKLYERMDISRDREEAGPFSFFEADLSRLIHHANTKSFGIVTAFRRGEDNEHPVDVLRRNRKNNKELLQHLSSHKMGPIMLKGHWPEAPKGMDYKDAEAKGMLKKASEESFFVPKPDHMSHSEFHGHMVNAMHKYNQDSVIVGDDKGNVACHNRDGSSTPYGKGMPLNKMANAYSAMRKSSGKGRFGQDKKPKGTPQSEPNKFVFEGCARPTGMLSAQAFIKSGLNWFGSVTEQENLPPFIK